MRRVLVLQGPNLNVLGSREPELYGTLTLSDIETALDALASELGVRLEHTQSNHEGVLVDRIQQAAAEGIEGAIVNAASLTHTSIAIRDALGFARFPFVEVHLSNVHAREPFRHTSLLADLAVGVVAGFRADSYLLGLRGLLPHLRG